MRFASLPALVLASLASVALASDVIDVKAADFDALVAGPLVLMEFFAPWVSHCPPRPPPSRARFGTSLTPATVWVRGAFFPSLNGR